MEYTYRPITKEEMPVWNTTITLVFADDPPSESEAAHWERWTELDRTIGGFDGTELIGTAGAMTFRTVVPGGEAVATAGVTAVTVKPTHRRRGVLTEMMRRQLEDVRERGEPLASLWASESVIYGRFGYGNAIRALSGRIERPYARFRFDVVPEGSVRLVDEQRALEVFPGIYESAIGDQPGHIIRRQTDWTEFFYDPERWRDGFTARRYAICEGPDGPTGYVSFRQKADWSEGHGKGTVRVVEMRALHVGAYAALWEFLFGIDLMHTFRAYSLALDDPLLAMLADPRRLKLELSDSVWVRLVDVPAALGSRRYQSDDRMVIEVIDAFCPWAGGRFELEGGPNGSQCTRTDADPDIIIQSADLASAYLGDPRLTSMAWSGRIEGSPAAVARLQAMFGWHRKPACSVHF